MVIEIIIIALVAAGLYYKINLVEQHALGSGKEDETKLLGMAQQTNDIQQKLATLNDKIESNIEFSKSTQNQLEERGDELKELIMPPKTIVKPQAQQASNETQEDNALKHKALQQVFINGFSRLYAKPPSKDNFFLGKLVSKEIGKDSSFEFFIPNNNPRVGYYRILDTPENVRRAVSNPKHYLFKACQVLGVGNIMNAQVLDVSLGIIEKDGDDWKVTDRCKVEFSMDLDEYGDNYKELLEDYGESHVPVRVAEFKKVIKRVLQENKDGLKRFEAPVLSLKKRIDELQDELGKVISLSDQRASSIVDEFESLRTTISEMESLLGDKIKSVENGIPRVPTPDELNTTISAISLREIKAERDNWISDFVSLKEFSSFKKQLDNQQPNLSEKEIRDLVNQEMKVHLMDHLTEHNKEPITKMLEDMEEHVSKEVFYIGTLGNGTFTESSLEKKMNSNKHIYEVHVIGETSAEYMLINNERTLTKAFNLAQTYIHPGFDVWGSPNQEKHTVIKGILRKEKKNWQIVRKGILME